MACGDYETCHYQRWILLDLNSMARTVLTSEYLGDYNVSGWSADSTNFHFIYYTFKTLGEKEYQTVACRLSDDGTVVCQNISDSDFADLHVTEHNIGLYTTSNNFLSILDKGLYEGQTGRLIKYLSCAPNAFGDGKLFGYDEAGIYFCDSDGSDLITIDGEICPCYWGVEPDTGDNDVDGLDLYHFVNSTFDSLDNEGFASEFGRTDCF